MSRKIIFLEGRGESLDAAATILAKVLGTEMARTDFLELLRAWEERGEAALTAPYTLVTRTLARLLVEQGDGAVEAVVRSGRLPERLVWGDALIQIVSPQDPLPSLEPFVWKPYYEVKAGSLASSMARVAGLIKNDQGALV